MHVTVPHGESGDKDDDTHTYPLMGGKIKSRCKPVGDLVLSNEATRPTELAGTAAESELLGQMYLNWASQLEDHALADLDPQAAAAMAAGTQ